MLLRVVVACCLCLLLLLSLGVACFLVLFDGAGSDCCLLVVV